MSEFDDKAATWDDKPERIERAEIVANEIIQFLPENKQFVAFEYGCGTGTLSFQLQNYFNKIILADNSRGMLEVLNQKISQTGAKNMHPVMLDMEKNKSNYAQAFDIVYTMLTLHHIENYQNVLINLAEIIKSGGFLFIIDLYKEDGSFHSGDFSGHFGFDPEAMKVELMDAGLTAFKIKDVFNIDKQMEGQQSKYFPVFLLKAEKPEV